MSRSSTRRRGRVDAAPRKKPPINGNDALTPSRNSSTLPSLPPGAAAISQRVESLHQQILTAADAVGVTPDEFLGALVMTAGVVLHHFVAPAHHAFVLTRLTDQTRQILTLFAAGTEGQTGDPHEQVP